MDGINFRKKQAHGYGNEGHGVIAEDIDDFDGDQVAARRSVLSAAPGLFVVIGFIGGG